MALPYGTCPLPMSPPHVLCPLSPSLRPISPSTRPLSPAICPMPPAPYSTSPSLCPSPCVPCPLPCVPRPQPHTSRPQPCVPAGAQAQCHPPRWLQRDRTPPWDTGAPLGSPPPTSPAQWLHVPGRCDKVTTRGGVSRIQGVSGTHVCPVPVLPLTSQGSAPRGRFCFQKPPRSRGAPGAAVPGMAACWGTWTGRHVLSVATGAGAIYLLYRTVADGLSSAPDSTECYRLESPDHREGLPVEEVLNRKVCEELLEMLRVQQDGRSRSAILRSITRCIHLMDTEKPTCSPEHIELVASCLDDPNRDTKIQALNTLRAFVTRSLFTDKIRDYYPKILDMVTCSRDMGVHLAELQLLNALPVPPNIEPLLRRTVPNLLGFLQLDNHNIQLQVLRLLVTLSRMEELLPDILNCQVRPEILSLLNNSQPEKLLSELLLLLEVLHEGCSQPRRPSKSPKSDSCSLYEVLFGENSDLADRLMVMFVHPDQTVQVQACKLVMKLQLHRLDGEVAAALSRHRAGSTALNHILPSVKSAS
ncbi:armadillo repeat-containing protein 12 isoform X2 [Anas acuta]|uniref:armadillo repeat-containing protein 12 isoform X2 n=1 Tax=Anas acuta TaxID=28680 RepID=UPI0035C8A6A4